MLDLITMSARSSEGLRPWSRSDELYRRYHWRILKKPRSPLRQSYLTAQDQADVLRCGWRRRGAPLNIPCNTVKCVPALDLGAVSATSCRLILGELDKKTIVTSTKSVHPKHRRIECGLRVAVPNPAARPWRSTSRAFRRQPESAGALDHALRC